MLIVFSFYILTFLRCIQVQDYVTICWKKRDGSTMLWCVKRPIIRKIHRKTKRKTYFCVMESKTTPPINEFGKHKAGQRCFALFGPLSRTREKRIFSLRGRISKNGVGLVKTMGCGNLFCDSNVFVISKEET